MLCDGANGGGARGEAVAYSASLFAAHSEREILQEQLPGPFVEHQVVHTNEENVIIGSFTQGKTRRRLGRQVERLARPSFDRLDHGGIGSRRQHRRILEQMLRLGADTQMRLTVDLGNPRAQCRMALQHRFQSLFNDALAGTSDAQSESDVVADARGLGDVQEPQSTLHRRERWLELRRAQFQVHRSEGWRTRESCKKAL